jgi:hypothetical protein
MHGVRVVRSTRGVQSCYIRLVYRFPRWRDRCRFRRVGRLVCGRARSPCGCSQRPQDHLRGVVTACGCAPRARCRSCSHREGISRGPALTRVHPSTGIFSMGRRRGNRSEILLPATDLTIAIGWIGISRSYPAPGTGTYTEAVGVATMQQPRPTALLISSSSIWLYPS